MSPRLVATLVLALGGLGLGLASDASDLRTVLLCAAAIAALGTRPGLLFGALTLVSGVGVAPAAVPLFAPLAVVGSALAGVALGLLGRELERHIDVFARDHRALMIALAALVLALTFILPDPPARLVLDGAPAMFDALAIDPATATRLWRPIPALIAYGGPLEGLEPVIIVFAGIVVFAGLAHAALRRDPREVAIAAWVTAGAAAVVALLALFDLVFGSITLDAAALRQELSLSASASGPLLDLATPASADLALWSRPLVDGLRLVAAFVLGAAPFVKERSQTSADHPWLLLALAAAVLALPLVPLPMALAGGVMLGVGALVAGRTGKASDLAPRVALVLVMVLWIWGAIARAPFP